MCWGFTTHLTLVLPTYKFLVKGEGPSTGTISVGGVVDDNDISLLHKELQIKFLLKWKGYIATY